jgi:ABC-type iron transport system FetAB ATPase subunit
VFGSKLITTPLRKATKVVVYTAIPVAGPLKAATMGTRRGNLNRKEVRKQTSILEQQNSLLAQQIQDGQQVPYQQPQAVYTPPAVAEDIPAQLAKLGQLRDDGVLSEEEFLTSKTVLLARI